MSHEPEDNPAEDRQQPPLTAGGHGENALPDIDLVSDDEPAPRVESGLRAGTVAAAALGLAAAWIAAGSVGLMGHPLRAGLTWLALGGVLLAAVRPGRHRGRRGLGLPWMGGRVIGGPSLALLAVLGVTALAVVLAASPLPAVNVLAPVVLLAVLAATEDPPGRGVLRTAAEAALVFALYRLALVTLPVVWLAADRVAEGFGWLTGQLTGCPLWVGPTFAGLDFLVVMLYVVLRTPFACGALAGRSPADGELPADAASNQAADDAPLAGRPNHFRLGRLIAELAVAVAVVLLVHQLYLILLTFGSRWQTALPTLPPPDPDQLFDVSPRRFVHTLRNMVPWNLPAVAAVLSLMVAAAAWWWWGRAARLRGAGRGERSDRTTRSPGRPAPRSAWPAAAAAVISLAVFLPLVALPHWAGPASLQGKKIVILEEGYLNWLKPVHGDYGSNSMGMYGMFPVYLESLGADCVISRDLSEEDLSDADLLVLLYPDKPWRRGQLPRIWDFVRRGGALLVMGEHTVREPDVPDSRGGNRFNEVLGPTGMRVPFDSATFEVGGWLQSYQPLAHPTTSGIRDAENDFGSVIGASVDVRWPARPLLVGRWGWADPGDESNGLAMMGNNQYDPGERLGDLVLAAEQPFGRGKIMAFGDTSGLTNGLTIGCHVFTSRLLAYLADSENRPPTLARQLLTPALGVILMALLVWRREAGLIAVAAVACGLVLVIQTEHVHRVGEILPDADRLKTAYDLLEPSILAAKREQPERPAGLPPAPGAAAVAAAPAGPTAAEEDSPPSDTVRPYELAYLDGSHLHAYSPESWRDDGTMGLCLTLLRNGYLTLTLPEVTAARLRGANLLVSIAPSREYSESEQAAIEGFVRRGGSSST